jgi:tryptophan-rich sensory protein
MIAVALWLYLNFAPHAEHNPMFYDTTLAMGLLVNYFLNKMWHYLFYKRDLYWLAAVDAVLVALTACAVEVLMWIHFRSSGYIIAAGVLYEFYVIWSIWSAIRSIDVAYHNASGSLFEESYEIIDITPGPTSTGNISQNTSNLYNQRVQQRWGKAH